jgi:hypothetical protein
MTLGSTKESSPKPIFNRLVVSAALIGLAATLGACDGTITINGEEGVPLAELDTSGVPPTELALLGPDTVIISEGDALSIEAEGDKEAVAALRFTLEDGKLGISRDNDAGTKLGTATVRVTMPAAEKLDMLGSGAIQAPAMASDADINIGGSGTIVVARLAATRLDLAILGSGSVTARGTVEQLDLKIAGSGSAKLAGVRVDNANVDVVGSGSSAFASDGSVDANIVGSGDVTVAGSATCEARKVGSGTLTCTSGE